VKVSYHTINGNRVDIKKGLAARLFHSPFSGYQGGFHGSILLTDSDISF